MEKVQGQEITTTEQKLEVYTSDIALYLQQYVEEHGLKEKDLYTMSQNRWNSVLLYVYSHVFAPTKDTYRRYQEKSNIDYSNKDLLENVCNIYINLCYEYEKEVSIMGFSKLTGITKETLYQWLNGAETQRGSSDLVKKLDAEREESLSNKLVSGKGNALGLLGVLNRQFGWNMGQPRGQDARQKAPDIPNIERKYIDQQPEDAQKQQPPEPEF